MSTKDLSWGKGGRCVRLPNVKKIRGLNLPGTPWATFTFIFSDHVRNLQEAKAIVADDLFMNGTFQASAAG